MNDKYLCTSCGKCILPDHHADGQAVCPEGDHHKVFTLIEASDIINEYLAYSRMKKEQEMFDEFWEDYDN